MIEVAGLKKLYDQFVAVDALSFSVQPGQVLGLVGPNGAGKTTTLRCMAGIIPPTQGEILISGVNLGQQPVEAKRQLAFFPDEPRLFDALTVQQHLTFTARIYQVTDYKPRAQALLAEFELDGKEKLLPSELSRGMKQKLSLACGLLHSPKAILFDEPLTGLDPIGIRRMKDAILKLAQEGRALLISSHLLHLLEEVCSHVLILKQGRKLAEGTLEQIRAQFSDGSAKANLEDIFIRATSENQI